MKRRNVPRPADWRTMAEKLIPVPLTKCERCDGKRSVPSGLFDWLVVDCPDCHGVGFTERKDGKA